MTNELSILEFRVYISSIIQYYKSQKNSVDKEDLIDSVCQFNIPEYKFLNRNQPFMSNILRKAFKNYINKKPNRIAINIWLAYEIGYKKCIDCEKLLLLNNYGIDNSRWDKLSSKCKSCCSQRDYIYGQDNKDKIVAKAAKRRATKLQRTPEWLTKQDWVEIQDIYKLAEEKTKKYSIVFHVDHIVPLQGKNVSGLHVPWNLQILTEKENLEKGNKY